MSTTDYAPPPRWLVRLCTVSAVMAVLALSALLWSKWGLAVVIASDVMKFCF